MSREAMEQLDMRITEYLSMGGLFNPEMALHDRVSELLMDCRAALRAALAAQTGQVVVPAEPSEEICEAMYYATTDPLHRPTSEDFKWMAQIYKAALRAAAQEGKP